MPSYGDEFPLLALFGLYASDIAGDGNCLFNALSDQMYGTQEHHAGIRARVIEFMRAEAAYYKQFLEVYPGGGTRRNPKRKNAGTYTTAQNAPSAADVDRVFEEHVTRMSKGGAWGDNMEIQAFAAAYDINVKIYQRDFAYIISAPGGATRPMQHVAYHTWEHYSSIRNIDGPHHGLPNVNPKPLSPALESEQQTRLNNAPSVLPWQVDELHRIYPNADKATITRVLEEARGNLDVAYEKLLTADEQRSVSSQHSSSGERDPDSGNESGVGPNKRQDRRMSRASKPTHLRSQLYDKYRHVAGNADKYGDSLESLVNATAASHSSADIRNPTDEAELSEQDDEPDNDNDEDDDEDDNWTPKPLNDGDTSSGSEYSSTPPGNQTIRINISLPPNDTPLHKKPPLKSKASQKRPLTAREKKYLKKQAQNQAAKERKQMVNKTKKSSATAAVISTANHANHPVSATTAMRTLYI